MSIFLFSAISFAQTPTDSELKAKIRANYKGLSSLQLEGNGVTKKEFEDGAWKYYYYRSFNTNFKNPDYPDVTAVVYGSIRYIKAGNRFVFNQFSSRGTKMLGAKPPSKKEILDLINANLADFFRFSYDDIIGDISEFTVPNNNEYYWDDLDHVKFKVKVTYSEKVSPTKVETAEHTYEVHFYSDGYKKPWKKLQAFGGESEKKVISTKTYLVEELAKIKTLAEIDEQNSAQRIFDKLPSVENPPVFKSDKQLFYYLHNQLMHSDNTSMAKAHLYKVMSKSLFESGLILKSFHQDWFDKVVNNIGIYQKTHCEYPKVKEEQSGMITFYNKERDKILRMTAREEEGTWKLSVMSYYPQSNADANRLANVTGTCGEKPDLEIKEVVKYEIGDVVDVTFSNGVFTATVNKKDTSFDNRYYIKLVEGGRGYWVTDDKMKKSNQKIDKPQSLNDAKSINSQEQNTSETKEKQTFNIGDAVGIRTRSGVMKGKIIKYASNKFLIKLDDAGYQDMWVSPEHLIKE
jgi:hypothetical protein